MIALVGAGLIAIGCGFFVVGTVGLLRFPDVFSRLHALTKADNVGLGFVVAGLSMISGSLAVAVKLILVWFLALVSAATVAQLIARRARQAEYPGSPVDNNHTGSGS